MLTPRKIAIFKAIVEEFVQSAEPVGSKTLIDKYQMPYSSATIRNEMNDLEKLGLLEKTHTSSGRVPSTKGYRFYVEHLMDDAQNEHLEQALVQVFSERSATVDEVIRQSCDILAQMTHLTSMVLGPESVDETLKEIRLLPLGPQQALAIFVTDGGHVENHIFNLEGVISVEEMASCTELMNQRLAHSRLDDVVDKMENLRPLIAAKVKNYESLFESFVHAFLRFASDYVYYSGEQNLLDQPEFANVEKLKELTGMLENTRLWRNLSEKKGELTLKKGDHSELIWFDDMAVVSSSVKLDDDDERKLMIVGPSRMDYDQIVNTIEYVTRMIERVYGKGKQDE